MQRQRLTDADLCQSLHIRPLNTDGKESKPFIFFPPKHFVGCSLPLIGWCTIGNQENPPVYIMSWMDGVTLHVQFYGKHPKEWDTINVYSQTTNEIPPLSTVKYVVDQNLKKGEKVLSTSGNWGYEASAWRDFVKDGEVIRTGKNTPAIHLRSIYSAPIA